MSPEEREPSADQLLAMAYADGELDAEAARDFERRMAGEPELAREVTDLRKLELLARAVAPPEPQDHEWARLYADPLQRVLKRAGMVLLVAGIALEMSLALTGLAGGSNLLLAGVLTLAGFTLLLSAAIRWRKRCLPYDPYVEVKR